MSANHDIMNHLFKLYRYVTKVKLGRKRNHLDDTQLPVIQYFNLEVVSPSRLSPGDSERFMFVSRRLRGSPLSPGDSERFMFVSRRL